MKKKAVFLTCSLPAALAGSCSRNTSYTGHNKNDNEISWNTGQSQSDMEMSNHPRALCAVALLISRAAPAWPRAPGPIPADLVFVAAQVSGRARPG